MQNLMSEEVRRLIRINTNSKEEEFRIMNNIHRQLMGK